MKFRNNKGSSMKKADRLVVYALIIAMLSVVSFSACACGAQAYADTSNADEVVSKLAADGTDTVELKDSITLPDLVYVNGTKTLKGTGTLTGKTGDYIIVVNSGASFTLDGVTISGGNAAGNGIYVSEKAIFNMASGTVRDVRGVAVRVLGTAKFTGGSISGAGENWLMVDTGASVDAVALDCSDSGAAGIITAEGSSLSLGSGVSLSDSKSNLLYNGGEADISGADFGKTEEYGIYNNGKLSITETEFSDAKVLGYLENSEVGECTIENSVMKDSKADFIYNHGKMSLSNVVFDNCKSTAFEGRGAKSEISISNCAMDNIGKTAILCKNGSLTIDNLDIGKCGGNGIHSRGCEVSGKGITIKECGAIGFLNDFPSENDDAGVKSFAVDGFEIGHCAGYAIRSNGEYIINDSEYGVTSINGQKSTASTNDTVSTEDSLEDDEKADIPDDVDEEGIIDDSNHPEDDNNDSASNGKPGKPHVTLSNGKVGKSDSYGLYVKGGDVILNNVEFLGTNDTDRAVIQVGYSKTPGGRLTLNNTNITGGKRGINNYSILIMNSGNIYGNAIGKFVTSTGAGVYNAGTFIMNGGMISGNACANSGGGVSNAKDAHFDMYGGIITQNSSGGYGGGVTNSGYFNLYNGTITDNFSVKGGGGVRNACVAGLYGGVIKENRVEKGSGGGLYCSGSDTCVSGVCIRDNFSWGNGGGVYNRGKMTIQGTTSVYNNTVGNDGGGVYNSGAVYMSDGRISGAVTLDETHGGGVINSGTFSFNGGVISGNALGKKGYGGGVYNSGRFAINGGVIREGKAVRGGGLYCTSKGSVNFVSGSIESCYAIENGGAVYTYGGPVNIAGNIVSCSSDKSGAALYITNNSKTSITAGTITTSGDSTGIFANKGACSISGSPIIKTSLSRNSENGSFSISGGWFIKPYTNYVAKGYSFTGKKTDAPDKDAPYTVEPKPLMLSMSVRFTAGSALESLKACENDDEAAEYLSAFNVDQLDELYWYVQNNVELLEAEGVHSGERQAVLLRWITAAIDVRAEMLYDVLSEYEDDYQQYLNTLTNKELKALKSWMDRNNTGLSELEERELKDKIAGTPFGRMQSEEGYLDTLDTEELQELRDYIISAGGEDISDEEIEMTDRIDAAVENIAKANLARLEEMAKTGTEDTDIGESELTEEEREAARCEAEEQTKLALKKYVDSLSEEELKALSSYIDKLKQQAAEAEKAVETAKNTEEGISEEEAEIALQAAEKAAEEARKAAEEAKLCEAAVELAKAEKMLENAKEGEFFADEVLTVLLSKDSDAERTEIIKGYTLDNMNALLEVINNCDTTEFTEEERVVFAAVKKLVEDRIAELSPPPAPSLTQSPAPVPAETTEPAAIAEPQTAPEETSAPVTE